jgi:ubiquinone/menaquinone biosynthesis C-methylase UbiE
MKKDNLQKTKKDKSTSWGIVADWYDNLVEGEKGTYQADLILPNLLRLVAPVVQDRILDIACGQGFFSRVFAEKGAKVTAADISPELIKIAREHSSRDISFYIAPADRLDFAKDASFDKAVIVLALQNIENIAGALGEASRILKKGGRLFIVLNHPAFRVLKNSSWEWDEKAAKQYRRIDAYMSESRNDIEMNPGAKNPSSRKTTVSFHRPLQSYFKALSKAGFAVTRLEEWVSGKESKPGLRSAEENRTRHEIPLFLFLEAVKM